MPDRPIILTDWQVRAVQEGRLKQIRVPVSQRLLDGYSDYDDYCNSVMTVDRDFPCVRYWEKGYFGAHAPFQPGDILYARETWCPVADGPLAILPGIAYKSDMAIEWVDSHKDGLIVYNAQKPDIWKWCSPATMPREAARLFLTVGEVRVQKASEATEKDAIAEGHSEDDIITMGVGLGPFVCKYTGSAGSAKRAAMVRWNARYARKYPWAEGLWTFVATVKA